MATTLKVESARTVATVQPRSRVAFELPRDKDKLNAEKLGENEELRVGVSAELKVRGPDAARLVNSTQAFFIDMLQTMEQIPTRSLRTSSSNSVTIEDDYNKAIARQFHQHLTSVLQSPRIPLNRSESLNVLLSDFSSVEGLLSHGVEQYIAAMKKLLKTGLKELQVDVALHRYNYSVATQGNTETTTTETVGAKCRDLFCFPCLGLVHILKQCAQSIEARRQIQDVHEALLHNDSIPTRLPVLKDVTCLVKPGRLTLVLGPPGSGKTSLLKAMSGQLLRAPGKNFISGELAYNGRPVSSLKNVANWVAYASQNDEHMPLLTVRETLNHAFRCRKEIRFTDEETKKKIRAKFGEAAVERLESFKDLDVDVALAVLGLNKCSETVIGNDTLKGVSGGERRRVTLGEMLAVGTQVLCLDEISTGLDSAATLDICQYLRHTAHIMDQCIIVALLQPPPEVISLFDDVLVIAEGSIIYHGERLKMMEYFENLGFRCPPRKDLGDFLQELPTKGGSSFALSPSDLAERNIPTPPKTPAEFAARWKQSEIFKNEDAQVKVSLSSYSSNSSLNQQDIDIDELPQNPWYTQLNLALKWMWAYRMKEKVKIRAKFAQNIIMGILFGTLFYQIPKDEAYQKNILFLQVLMFSSQSAVPEVQSNARARSIYHKHIDQGFYKAWMLAFAQTVTSLPLVFLDTLIFGQLIYWLTGLAVHLESFVLFCIVSTLFGATMQSIMGIFPYIIRDEYKATIAAVLVLIVSILLSGVVATAKVIPSYLQPVFHINPLAWAFRVLANVEFLSPGYDDNPCPVVLNGKKVNVPQRCGDFFLASREIDVGWEYVWTGLTISALYLVVFWIITAIALTYVRFQPPRGNKKYRDSAEEEEMEEENLDRPHLRRQQSIFHEYVNIVVHELGYSIKAPSEKEGRLDLLKGISCWALPGRMLALMGSSGAGKTTLLDVLAGIKTVGRARGRIFLNGKPLKQNEFTRLAGYVQQFGVHSPTSTIRESLEFSLALRLPKEFLASDAERQTFIDETLLLLELHEIQHQLAGQCSMEQNKRLTLGVELVANPSIVFADEPTSSLDARAASIVMRVLQKVAKSGRVVIATIHQPSIAIFQRFDDLLLLKKGGQIVFFGELGHDSKNLIAYFESIPSVPHCPDGANPAGWMLDVIGGGTGVRKSGKKMAPTILQQHDDDDDEEENHVEDEIDFALIYRNSELKRRNDFRLKNEFGISDEYFTDVSLSAVPDQRTRSTTFKTSYMTQFRYVLYRNFVELWRSPDFSFLRFLVIGLFSSLFVAIFFQQDIENMADTQSRILCITFSTSLASMFTMMTIIPYSINRRALFYRERGSGMYHSAVFAMAAGTSELPYLLLNSMIIVNIVYFGVGFNSNTYPYEYFFVASFLYLTMMAFVGMMMASVFPEPLSAQLAASAFFSIMNTFAGISVPRKHIPTPYVWIHYFSPLRWYFEGILSTQFHGDDSIICNPLGHPVTTGIVGALKLCTKNGEPDLHQISGVQVTVEEFVLKDFLDGFEYERRYIDLIVILSWIIGLRLIAVLATSYISFDKR